MPPRCQSCPLKLGLWEGPGLRVRCPHVALQAPRQRSRHRQILSVRILFHCQVSRHPRPCLLRVPCSSLRLLSLRRCREPPLLLRLVPCLRSRLRFSLQPGPRRYFLVWASHLQILNWAVPVVPGHCNPITHSLSSLRPLPPCRHLPQVLRSRACRVHPCRDHLSRCRLKPERHPVDRPLDRPCLPSLCKRLVRLSLPCPAQVLLPLPQQHLRRVRERCRSCHPVTGAHLSTQLLRLRRCRWCSRCHSPPSAQRRLKLRMAPLSLCQHPAMVSRGRLRRPLLPPHRKWLHLRCSHAR